MKYTLERKGTVYELDVELTERGVVLRGPDGKPELVAVHSRPDGSQRVVTPWGELELVSARRGAELWADVAASGEPGAAPQRLSARVQRTRPTGAGSSNGVPAGAVIAPMAGKLLRILTGVGAQVKAGQALAVIEAMKMENELLAPLDGVVVELPLTAPSAVDKGALIVRIEPA